VPNFSRHGTKLPADTDFSSLINLNALLPLWTSLNIFIVCLFLVYTLVTPMATAMVLLYRFYCIFVYHVLIILHVYFASWGQLQELIIALFVQLVYCHV